MHNFSLSKTKWQFVLVFQDIERLSGISCASETGERHFLVAGPDQNVSIILLGEV